MKLLPLCTNAVSYTHLDVYKRQINNLFFLEKRYDLGDVGRYRINKKLNLTTDMDVRVPVSYTHLRFARVRTWRLHFLARMPL